MIKLIKIDLREDVSDAGKWIQRCSDVGFREKAAMRRRWLLSDQWESPSSSPDYSQVSIKHLRAYTVVAVFFLDIYWA